MELMEFGIGYVTAMVFGLIAILVFTSVIGALTLRVATKVSANLEATADLCPTFREAYKISFIACLVASAIGFPLGFIVGFTGKDFNIFGYILLATIGFFSNAAVIVFRLKHPDQRKVGLGRASWFTAIQIVVALMVGYWLVKLFEFITT